MCDARNDANGYTAGNKKIMPVMFSLFGKKNEEPPIKMIDLIWISSNAKMNACINLLKEKPAVIFVRWFEETLQQLQSFFSQHSVNGEAIIYRQASKGYIHERPVIFIEHYPIAEKESELFISLGLKEAIIYNALDEPLFQYFGGAKITTLLANLGMQESESLEHPMIQRALKNAQEKINKQIKLQQTSRSQQEWFKRNLST